MRLGESINSCRKVRGMTLDTLASKSGLSTSYLSLVEKSKREPTLTSVKSIAEALDIPFYVLIFLSSSETDLKEITPSSIDALKQSINDLLVIDDAT